MLSLHLLVALMYKSIISLEGVRRHQPPSERCSYGVLESAIISNVQPSAAQ